MQAQSYYGILANDAYLAKIETDDSTFATREFWCAYDTSTVKIEVEAVSIVAGGESRTIEWEPIHDTISIESNDIVRLKMMTDTIDIASQDTLHIFLGGIASDEQIVERISGITVGVYDATDSSLIDSWTVPMSAFAIDTMKYLDFTFGLSDVSGEGRIIMMQFAVDDDSGCYFGVNDKLIRDLIPYEQEKTIQGQPPLPQSIRLGRNFPNPFNGTTSIPFELPADRHVHLSVHDRLGRLVKVLVDADIKAGTHISVFESVDLPSDVYYARLAVAETVLIQGLILIR